MASAAFDVFTTGKCLDEISKRLGLTGWNPTTHEQRGLMNWYTEMIAVLQQFDGADLPWFGAQASTDYVVLNNFMEAHGQPPQFKPFNGFGVAAVIDVTDEWRHGAQPVDLLRIRSGGPTTFYKGFRIPDAGARMFRVQDMEHPLIRLSTTSGRYVWIIEVDKAYGGYGAFRLAQMIQSGRSDLLPVQYSGVQIPDVNLSTQPDLSWLVGMTNTGGRETYAIVQAFQHYLLEMTYLGLRLQVGTGVSTSRSPQMGQPYTVTRPFVFWVTALSGNPNPVIGSAYVDLDSWVPVG